MQNPQMAQMATMNAGAGPIDGTPVMANGQRQAGPGFPPEPRQQLNTYIYDYFLRTDNPKLAKAMLDAGMHMDLKTKPSPSNRNMNGVDPADDLPPPNLPDKQATEASFLLDWWVQFWDIFGAMRGRQNKGVTYIQHTRVSVLAFAHAIVN